MQPKRELKNNMQTADINITSCEQLESLFGLKGQTALITGGSGVLGEAMARGLGLAGARIYIAARTKEKVAKVVESLGEKGIEAHAVAMDATAPESVEAALAAIAGAGHGVDILLNAAGGNQPQATAMPGERTFFDLGLDALRQVVDLNLFGGAVIPSMVVGKAMHASGRPCSIINITSVAADLPITRVAGYGAAKAAVANFTQWLSTHLNMELNASIRVNAIMPGFYLTEQNRFLLTNADGSLTARGHKIIDNTPMNRFGGPDELIGATVYLASRASSFVTGTTVVVDGGFTSYAGV